MMRLVMVLSLMSVILFSQATWAAFPVKATSTRQAQEWLRWVIPLPKEVKIAQHVTLPADEVKLTFYGNTGGLAKNALRKLRSLFLDKVAVDASKGGEFEIVLGLCDQTGRLGAITVPDAGRLSQLPNSEQAYIIRPIGTNCLVLTALDARGLFYAALTLKQLLESKFSNDRVSMPLAVVTDWPDLAERGLWGGSSKRDIEWLAERKMNLVEFHSRHHVTDDGKAISSINRSLLRRGRLNAVKLVPIISHLNGIGRRGVYKAFPELRRKGKRVGQGNRALDVPYASHPQLQRILADWMFGYASYEGVRDISCWLSEPRLPCAYEACEKIDHYALEARAFVKAWRSVRKRFPDLRIRILLTQGSYDSNNKVLAEIPPEVGVTYYHGARTYDSSPNPMIYPLLEEYAAKDRWLGCYPQLTPSFRIVSPWSCPQFIRFRMTEFFAKKLSCLVGYVVPDNRLYDLNVTAAAEWSWNAYGRDEREFTIAWATRSGFAMPKRVAEWALKLGTVAWDLYGAGFVEQYLFFPDTIVDFVLAGSKPLFGRGFLTYIKDEQHLRRNLVTCREALFLADQIGSPAIIAETRAVGTYYEIVNRLCRLRAFLAEGDTLYSNDQPRLQKELNHLTLAGVLNIDALRDWERSAARVGAGRLRFLDGVQATEDTVQYVARALEPFGLRNPAVNIMNNEIAAWAPDHFREAARIKTKFNITPFIVGPGTYRMTFQYTGGSSGLEIYKVELWASSKESPGGSSRLGADEHYGVTANRSSGNVYILNLDEYDPSASYWMLSDIKGARPQDQPPGRTGCRGIVYLRREKDLDWQVSLMNVQPYKNVISADKIPKR